MTLSSLAALLLALPLASTSPANPLSLFGRATCSTPYGDGTCLSTSSCTTGGFHIADYCSGPTDIQCCVEKTCTTSSGSGMCMNTQNTCSGKFVAGACPGPSDIQVRWSGLNDKDCSFLMIVQCCTKEKCSTSSGSGVCQVTSTSCSGKYVAGACPGPSNVEVCIFCSQQMQIQSILSLHDWSGFEEDEGFSILPTC